MDWNKFKDDLLENDYELRLELEKLHKQEVNNSLSILHDELKTDKRFGSLFQFWVSEIIHELEEHFGDENYDKTHNAAICIVKRIAQE